MNLIQTHNRFLLGGWRVVDTKTTRPLFGPELQEYHGNSTCKGGREGGFQPFSPQSCSLDNCLHGDRGMLPACQDCAQAAPLDLRNEAHRWRIWCKPGKTWTHPEGKSAKWKNSAPRSSFTFPLILNDYLYDVPRHRSILSCYFRR